MKKDSNNPKKPGFGFGDAMFAMKDLQTDYSMFNQPTTLPKPSDPPKKIIIPAKNPALVNKVILASNVSKNVVQKQNTGHHQKVEFKVNPGKEFQSNLKIVHLNKIQLESENVIELTEKQSKSKWEYNVFCDGVTADQIVAVPEISFNFNAEDIKQGQLGNCYFICALASIAHHPKALRERIPEFKKYSSKEKTYRVNMFESGKNIEILVDNLFPTIYCKPIGNDISPMVLEKAYAQIYGNYKVICLGHANDALRDLTGAPTEYIDLKQKKNLIAKLTEAFSSKYGVAIASKQENLHELISPKHSYNVLSFQIIHDQVYLRLRDPRGWAKAQFQIPEELVNNFDNGMFWIGLKDLIKYFEVITVCKLEPNNTYFYKTFNSKELTNKTGGLILNPLVNTKVCISIHQKHKKFFDQKFKYDILRVLIAEVDVVNNEFKVEKTIKCNFNAQQVCTLELNLQAKKRYLVVGQIGKNKGKELFPQEIFTMSCYSEKNKIEFEQVIGNIDVKSLLSNYIQHHPEQFKETITDQGLYRYHGPLFGYVCIFYENKGKKHIIEDIQYVVQNIDITDKKVQLAPSDTKIIINAIGPENNCSHQCSIKTKTYYK